MATQIKKRNGSLVAFDIIKIRNAMQKANDAVQDEVIDKSKLNELTGSVASMFLEDIIPSVEDIQDEVERQLIAANFAKTAKAYILYRAEHTKIREAESDLMHIYQELTFSDAKDADFKRENANIDSDTAMGTMLKYGTEGSKYFTNNYVLPKDIAFAHINGDIHIHDQDFYMLTETCCQIDLLKLFKNGFSTGHGTLREPNDIVSYAALACIAIQANQNEMHGGQSVPNFDFAMAPGVTKTFYKTYIRELMKYFVISCNLDSDKTSKLSEDIVDAIGHITLSTGKEYFEKLKEFLFKKENPLKENLDIDTLQKAHDFAMKSATHNTDRKTYQAMEALIHNLNTMNSRAGAQVPFSSLNYGTDTSAEGRMVVKNLLLATERGLGGGETPIFPDQIFKVKEGVNFNKEDPNYDLFKLSMKVSAKRLFPNFCFLDAPFNLQFYKEGNPDTEVSYMGCRTRVIGNVYDKNRQITSGRGNLSFTSINLPRIGLEAKGDIKKFYELLDDKMDLVMRQLLHRFKIQSAKKVYNYPFLMGEGIWIDSDKLAPTDTIGEVLKHGTLSLGYIGLAECLKALIGKHHGEDEEGQKMGLEIIGYMRKKLDDKAQEMKLNLTLLATPAEGLSGRFVRMDRKKFGNIEGITDRDYYTNSFHVPVYYPISAFKKIELEAPYHDFSNAGHISYVELDGDTTQNMDAFETIIRHMQKCGMGYGAVNHPVDRDPVCGYSGFIHNECPKCHRKEDESYTKFERTRRITGYLVGTTDRWNDAKKSEEKDRIKHNI